jgi:competence protein CoiA
MHFALINNEKSEAQKGLQGICPGCLQPVIAKCGQQKINHWAHRANKTCDSWWESETEWHRSWKNNFPADWQEVFLPNVQNGEKHVADVRTPHGFVIEFQHSHINPEERVLREKFYDTMVWVVDGTRLKRDYIRFLKGVVSNFRPTTAQGIFLVNFPEECFPNGWIDSSVPVIFDFLGMQLQNKQNDPQRNSLWCLFPGRAEGSGVVAILSREYFINTAQSEPQVFISAPRNIVNGLSDNILKSRMQTQQAQTIEENRMFEQQNRSKYRGYRRFRF